MDGQIECRYLLKTFHFVAATSDCIIQIRTDGAESDEVVDSHEDGAGIFPAAIGDVSYAPQTWQKAVAF